MALPPTKYHENLPSGSEVGDTQTDRQTGDLIRLLSFLERRLKTNKENMWFSQNSNKKGMKTITSHLIHFTWYCQLLKREGWICEGHTALWGRQVMQRKFLLENPMCDLGKEQ
jgi:hypothetical protein